MLSLRIALRFLRTSPVQSGLIILGIAVGIGVQVFIGSLITSLQDSLLDRTIGSSSQITLKDKDEEEPVRFTKGIQETIRGEPRVTTVVPVRTLSAIYAQEGESATLNLTGGELGRLDTIYGLLSRSVRGRPRLRSTEIIVGSEFAAKYGVAPRDRIPLVLSDGSQVRLTVTAVFDLGVRQVNERSAFVSATFARAVLGHRADEYSQIEMQVDPVFDAADIAAGWRELAAFRSVEVTDWQRQNADLLSALQSQSTSSNIIQVFVLLAIALGITSTLAISAVQKTREIGILKAMGMGDAPTGRIFMWEAAVLGVCGSTLGVLVGLGLVAVFQSAAASNPGALFPIEVQPGFIVFSGTVGVTVALVSSIIPIRRTSRLDPIEVIGSG